MSNIKKSLETNFEENVCINFSKIYNKNEKRIQKILNQLIENKDSRISLFNEKDMQDVYALTLNLVHPRYIHHGTIVVREPVTSEELLIAIDDAICITTNRPKK